MALNKPNGTAQKERASRLPPAERRRQLTECAVRVFARYGLGNAGHAQVADEAGVSTPTVFLYLPNRQALIDAALDEVARYLVDMVESAAATERNARAKLLAVMRAFANAIDTDPDCVKVFLNWSTVVHDDTWPQYLVFQDRILDILGDIISGGIASGDIARTVDPVSGAHLVMGSAHMIAQMKFRGRSHEDIDRFLTGLLRGALSAPGD